MKRNEGTCPPQARGKRVRVRLRNGNEAKGDWAADGNQGCRWSDTGSPFDVMEYEVVE